MWLLGGCAMATLLAMVACVLIFVLIGGLVSGLVVSKMRTTGVSTTTTEMRALTVTGRPDITVTNDNGQVTVQAGAAGAITITASKTAYGTTSAQALDGIHVNVSQSGDSIRVSTSSDLNTNIQHQVNLTLTVPARSDVTVENGTGNVQISDIAGKLSLQTATGTVQTTGVTFANGSSIQVHTGDIRLNGTLAAGCALEARASVGAVTGELSLAGPTHMDIRTGAGTLTLTGWNIPVTQQTPGARATGDSGSNPTGTLTVRVQVGNITLSNRTARA